jgi:hypothetical protein
MHCDATRHLDLLRIVRLEFLMSPTSQNTIRADVVGVRPAYNIADHCCCRKKLVVQRMYGALEKKKKISILVKCAHLYF